MYFLFAWRYFKAKKSTNAINIIAWISISAIIIGTTALILVLSVFNGLESLVKSLYSSFYTDLKIFPSSGKVITLTQQQLNELKRIPGVQSLALVAEEKGFLQNGSSQSMVFLKGVDDQYRRVTGVADNISEGVYDLGTMNEPRLVLGGGLEAALGIYADPNMYYLNVFLPRRTSNETFDVLNDISSDSITMSGAFRIQQDFDNKYGITNLEFVKQALRMGANEYSAAEIRLNKPDDADKLQQQMQAKLGTAYKVQTRYQQNQNLYAVMNLERWIIYGVLSLILVVAAFNIIGALTMLVLEKKKDISVLHALGGSKKFILRIFLAEGLLLAIIGGVAGMLLALIIAFLQINFHLIPLQGDSFLINYFPVELRWTDFLLVGLTVFVISIIASWLPARKAANQNFSLKSE